MILMSIKSVKHKLIDFLFAFVSDLSRISVMTYLFDRNLKVQRNIAYKTDVQTNQLIRLDCIESTKFKNKKPIIVHVHGGGFKDFSKESHSHVAAKFAKLGYYVVNINYRLIPKFPYPAALEDLSDAMIWIHKNLEKTKVDLNNIYMVGESAGANLILAYVLTQLNLKEKILPKKIILSCGLFDVSTRAVKFRSSIVKERINLMRTRYLNKNANQNDYIDLLSYLENKNEISDEFPNSLIQIGTKDVLFEQSILLNDILLKLNCNVTLKQYKDRGHALHAIPFAKGNEQIYVDMNDFLKNSN